MSQPNRKPVTTARVKTAKVRDKIRTATDDLHDANEVLADARANTAEPEKVAAAVEQTVEVEHQLHDAVRELKVVTDLLKEAEKTKGDSPITTAGNRSGEGLDSVIEHLNAQVRPGIPAR